MQSVVAAHPKVAAATTTIGSVAAGVYAYRTDFFRRHRSKIVFLASLGGIYGVAKIYQVRSFYIAIVYASTTASKFTSQRGNDNIKYSFVHSVHRLSLFAWRLQTVKPVLDEISKSKDMLKLLQEEMKGSDDSLKQV